LLLLLLLLLLLRLLLLVVVGLEEGVEGGVHVGGASTQGG